MNNRLNSPTLAQDMQFEDLLNHLEKENPELVFALNAKNDNRPYFAPVYSENNNGAMEHLFHDTFAEEGEILRKIIEGKI